MKSKCPNEILGMTSMNFSVQLRMLKDTFLLGAGLNSKRHISWTKTQTKYQVDVAISDVDNIFIDLYNAVLHYENMPIQIYWNFHHQKKKLKVFR